MIDRDRTAPAVDERRGRDRYVAVLVLLAALGWSSVASALDAVPIPAELAKSYKEGVRPLLQTYCIRCHDQETEKGGVRLDSLGPVITAENIATWTDVKNMLDVGSMPPKKESKRPTRDEQTQLLKWIGGSLGRYAAVNLESGGDTLLRRINHRAYANMIQSLLGVPAQGMESFPPDAATNGFDTVGSGLYATSYLYDQYLQCARQTLEVALTTSPTPPPVREAHWIGKDWAKGELHEKWKGYEGRLKALQDDPEYYAKMGTPEIQVQIWVAECFSLPTFDAVKAKGIDWGHDAKCLAAITAKQQELEKAYRAQEESAADGQPPESGGGPNDPFGRFLPINCLDSGYYTITTHLCLSDASRPLPVGIGVGGQVARQIMVYAPQGAPQAYEATVFLTKGWHWINVQPFHEFRRFTNYVNARYGTWEGTVDYHNSSHYNYPGVAIPTTFLCCDIAVRGPINEAWPPPATARIFTRGVASPPTRDYAEEIVLSFMKRAYAGGGDAAMAKPFVDLVMAHYEAEKDFFEAVKYGLAAVLSSPRFLYLTETQRSDTKHRRALSAHELARRLAYFLWSDLPDEALAASAESGKLTDDKELLAQTRRMLKDGRSQAFRSAFATQWLKVDKVELVAISAELFPAYDNMLIQSAKEETVAFFSEILDKNLSLANFIDSDFAMLNGRLAEQYGIAGVTGNEFRRVPLPPDSHRGGVLGQASVLITTSNGMVSSPVRRGAFVMERLLGVSPGVPPPNVPPLGKTANANADGTLLTPRERLAMHRENMSCARCHDLIDPLGVGLENYNALGAWNAKLLLAAPGMPGGKAQWIEREADVHGTMLDGKPYNGPQEMKQRLLDHRDQFARSFAENLVVYALGRPLELSDRPVLDDLCKRGAAAHDGLATLIENVVQCESFRAK